MWTNTSLPPSCGMMNPYPLVVLNHLTVPVAMSAYSPSRHRAKSRDAIDNRVFGPPQAPETEAQIRKAKIRLHGIVGTESQPCVNHTGDIRKNPLRATIS